MSEDILSSAMTAGSAYDGTTEVRREVLTTAVAEAARRAEAGRRGSTGSSCCNLQPRERPRRATRQQR